MQWPNNKSHKSIYPGCLNSAILSLSDSPFVWSTLARCFNHHPTFSVKTIPIHSSLPITCDYKLTSPNITARRRSEQATNFIRTHYPDVDIPSELVRHQVLDDIIFENETQSFDPFLGNRLAALPISNHSNSQIFAYASGSRNHQLTIATIDLETNSYSHNTTLTHQTPIQQIYAPNKSSWLAVRTFGGTHIYNPFALEEDTVSSFTVSRKLVGDRHIVDISSASGDCPLVVNDRGHIFRVHFSARDRTLEDVTPKGFTGIGEDPLFRLAGFDTHLCMRMSSHSLDLVDLRNTISQPFFQLAQDTLLTSVAARDNDCLVMASSTKEMIWFDKRMPRRPLLSVSHARALDRNLQCTYAVVDGVPLTMLFSTRNEVVTFYDVSRDKSGLAHLNALPSCFIGDLNPLRGQITLQSSAGKAMRLLQLDQSGILYSTTVSFSPNNVETPTIATPLISSDTLQNTPLDQQQAAVVDFSAIYHALFDQITLEKPETNADNIYNILDTVATFWQRYESNLNILTMLEMLLLLHEPQSDDSTSRAMFLSSSPFECSRGYSALLRGRLSSENLKEHSSWSQNLVNCLQSLDPAYKATPNEMLQDFRQFNLSSTHEYRSQRSFQLEANAANILTLHLSMSSTLFSHRASKAEGGSTQFRILEPLPSQPNPDSSEISLPRGVESLLEEWHLGTTPSEYDTMDPGPSHIEQMPLPIPIQVQAPPIVVPSQVQPLYEPQFASQPRPVTSPHSQPNPLPELENYPDLPSTQTLPGKYGSRPGSKPKKKRLGGF